MSDDVRRLYMNYDIRKESNGVIKLSDIVMNVSHGVRGGQKIVIWCQKCVRG